MRTRTALSLALVAGLAAPAAAQLGNATYSISFGTPGGPNSVFPNPGQSINVYVMVSFTPGVGQPYQNGTIGGLSDGAFSISVSDPGAGMWSSPSLPNPWGAQAVGGVGVNPGTASGAGVSGVVWGYGFLFGLPHPFPQNPAVVWQGVYTHGLAGFSVVNVSITNVAQTGVFLGLPGGGLPTVTSFNTSPGQGGTIFRIPTPATLCAFAIGAIPFLTRRR